MKITTPILICILALSPAYSQNESGDVQSDEVASELGNHEARERMKRVAAEIEKRRAQQGPGQKARKKREFDPTTNGAVYQPREKVPDSSEPVSFLYRNQSVGNIAQIYSILIGKEVMVSSTVSSLRLNFEAKDVPASKAIELFEREFAGHSIQIVDVGKSIIVLMKEE